MTGSGDLEKARRLIERIARREDPRFERVEIDGTADGDRVRLAGFATSLSLFEEIERTLAAEGVDASMEDVRRPSRESWGDEQRAVVSAVNIRREPDHRSELLTQAVLGEVVRVFLEKEGWALGRIADGYIGWVTRASLALPGADVRRSWDSFPRLRVTAREAVIRARPDDGSLPVRDVVFDSRLLIRSTSGRWVQVEIPDGTVGWIGAGHGVEEGALPPSPGITEILKTAKEMIGAPYLWGGTTPKGFDCSGLSQRVFGHHRVRLPRDVDMQMGAAVPLPAGAARKPGDLLFFGGEKATHVAISLGGADFIHASGWVRVESLNNRSPLFRKDLREIYLGAGRVPIPSVRTGDRPEPERPVTRGE